MKTILICTGDELLNGTTLNTNLTFIGDKLRENGLRLTDCIIVPDGGEPIRRALADALSRADTVITSGGLGPTADDMTREVIAQYLHLPLEQDGQVALAIHRFLQNHKKCSPEMNSRILNQTLVPKGAKVLLNRYGTAPGLILHTGESCDYPGRDIVILPGPPSELQPMFCNDVLPFLLKKSTDDAKVFQKLFYVAGVGESEVEERMLPIIAHTHPLNVAYCASPGLVKLFLNSPDMEVLREVMEYVREEFGSALLSDEVDGSIAAELVALLRQRGMTLSTAESCTGGLIAKKITDVSGCSDVYPGSVVSYANEIKERILHVSHQTLATVGAVSRETATQMVSGIANLYGVSCAISVTGIAGPGGGTPEKPVGLVYAGIKCGDEIKIQEYRFNGNRDQIRERTAQTVLNELRLMLLEK